MIPSSIDQVTPAWLSEQLGETVESIQPSQIGQGVGLMGDIYRADLKLKDGTKRKLVVKLPSSFEENRTQGVSLGMFEAEVRFYRELAPAASVGLPVIYHADIDPGSADFVILMEDLTDMTMVSQAEGMTVDQARAAVKTLANIHAVWWDNIQDNRYEWIPTMVGPRIEFVDQMLQEILPAFEAKFSEYLPKDGIELYRKFAGNYLKVNSTIAGRSPWTLVHQDYRVENILFGADGEAVVIDWQGIGRGPGAYDLAYILGGSMDSDLRRAEEAALTHLYHDTLAAAGISDYSYESLWQDYQLAHLQGGLATSMVTGGTMDLSNERGLNLIATMATRHASAALDHDGLQLLEDCIQLQS